MEYAIIILSVVSIVMTITTIKLVRKIALERERALSEQFQTNASHESEIKIQTAGRERAENFIRSLGIGMSVMGDRAEKAGYSGRLKTLGAYMKDYNRGSSGFTFSRESNENHADTFWNISGNIRFLETDPVSKAGAIN